MSEPAPAGWAEIGWVAAHRHTNWGKGGERQGRRARGVSARVRGEVGCAGRGESEMTTGGLGGR